MNDFPCFFILYFFKSLAIYEDFKNFEYGNIKINNINNGISVAILNPKIPLFYLI